MGDCGANLLGLLLGVVAVEGPLKTNALSCSFVPLADPARCRSSTRRFVVAKRLKYRAPGLPADSDHFHHRMARIGFSQRRTSLYLYAWTLMLAGLARRAALRPVLRPPRPLPHAAGRS